ncbi:Structural maintenance of chromosome protein 2, partial [Pseudoloma neurophilia]
KDSIQKINEQIQSTNNNETGQTEQRQHIIEVYEKNEQDLQLLFSRIEQLEKDKLVLNKNLNFLEKELTTKMDSLINFINKNVKNNWFINNIRLQLSKIGDLLITDSNNNPISINELSGGQKSLMAVSVMFTAVQYYDLHNIRISGDEIQASKTGEGTTSKDEKCWDTPLSEEKNTDTASMATHRESQGGVLCLFDEIDAALDPNQTERIASFLKTRGCQTLVISLKEGFYEQAERVYEIYRQGTGAKAQRV